MTIALAPTFTLRGGTRAKAPTEGPCSTVIGLTSSLGLQHATLTSIVPAIASLMGGRMLLSLRREDA